MKYPAIKLYGKTTLRFKAKDSNDIAESYNIIRKESLPLEEIQCVEITQATTQRKNNPIDVTVSFYDIKTIIEMIDDIGM